MCFGSSHFFSRAKLCDESKVYPDFVTNDTETATNNILKSQDLSHHATGFVQLDRRINHFRQLIPQNNLNPFILLVKPKNKDEEKKAASGGQKLAFRLTNIIEESRRPITSSMNNNKRALSRGYNTRCKECTIDELNTKT